MCAHTHILYTSTRGERKGTQYRHTHWIEAKARPIPLTQILLPRLQQVSVAGQTPQLSLRRSAPKALLRPPSLLPSFPRLSPGTLEARSSKGGSARPQGGGGDEPRRPRHLRGAAPEGDKQGPPGSAEHTPSADREARRPEAPYLRSPRATGARDASSSQRLRLPLRLPLPPPSPPPPSPPPPMEARTRRAQDSTAMSAAPRTALWGGRDREGEEEGARERGGPAEGRGLRESGAGKRGRGVRDAPQPGIPAGMGGDSLGGPEQSLPGLGSGALSLLILGIPPSTRQTSAEEG